MINRFIATTNYSFRNIISHKRQRWKSFKLRDDYEEIVYKVKVKKVKKPITQSFDEAAVKEEKKPRIQSFDEAAMKKIKKPRTHSFDEETLKKLKEPLVKGETCICLSVDIYI